MRMHSRAVPVVLLGLFFFSGAGGTVVARALQAATPQTAPVPAVTFTATSANVAEPGNRVRIQIFRWSTDQERAPVVAALNPPPAPPPSAGGGERGATGRGGPAGGGGRGRGAAPPAPVSPTEALATAIAKAPSIGYIWTNDVTGYAIKYAFRALTDDGERIILATDRRLGTYSAAWQPVVSTPLTDYEFTLIEMRLDAQGSGEAKTSLTTKVVVDKGAGTVALENYAATPAILQKVGRGPDGP